MSVNRGIKILVVEDEPLAAEKLVLMLQRQFPESELAGPLASVAAVIQWLERNSPPDLIFMDIQLADGLSFEIFEKREIQTPVIFTTAFDKYAINAFRVNSIDYLLKPIDPDDLDRSIQKFKKFGSRQPQLPDLSILKSILHDRRPVFKSRFVVKRGDHLSAVLSSDVHYFISMHKGTWLVDKFGNRHLIDQSMDQLSNMLDPNRFFRINRKCILSLEAISDMVSWSNSRLKIKLNHPSDDDVVVARDRVRDFKAWLEGE